MSNNNIEMNDLSQNYKQIISVWSHNIPEIKKHDQDLNWVSKHHKLIYEYIKNKYTNKNTLKLHISVLAGMLKLSGLIHYIKKVFR